jgi:hypothetical protein
LRGPRTPVRSTRAMATTARAWTHALCMVGFRLWRPSAPLKGGSLNEQQVRLDDGKRDVEAVFDQAARGWWRLAPFRGSPLAVAAA